MSAGSTQDSAARTTGKLLVVVTTSAMGAVDTEHRLSHRSEGSHEPDQGQCVTMSGVLESGASPLRHLRPGLGRVVVGRLKRASGGWRCIYAQRLGRSAGPPSRIGVVSMRNGGAGTARRGGRPAGRRRRVAPMLAVVAVNALVLGAAGALMVSAGPPAAAAPAPAPGDGVHRRHQQQPGGGGAARRRPPDHGGHRPEHSERVAVDAQGDVFIADSATNGWWRRPPAAAPRPRWAPA